MNARSDEEAKALKSKLEDEYSTNGFIYGYAGTVLLMIFIVPLTIFITPRTFAYRVSMVIAAAWWFIFSLISFAGLQDRKGLPLPTGVNKWTLGFKRAKNTFSTASQLPQTFWFLGAWFVYSDGMATIGSLGGLFANSEVEWQIMPQGLGIAVLFLLVPLMAGFGNFFFHKLCIVFDWTAKQVIIFNLVTYIFLGLWGIFGLKYGK